MDALSPAEVIAHRLQAHRLLRRADAADLMAVAGACGVQNSPPGSALLSLGARLEGLTVDAMRAVIAEERTLVQTWSVRGAPFVIPRADLAVFTTGVLPPDDEGRAQLLHGVRPAFASVGVGLDEAVDLVVGPTRAVLSGRRLDITELGREVAPLVGARLAADRRQAWEGPSPYATDQTLGEGVVHFCMRMLALRRVVCFAPRAGRSSPLVLVDEWLPDGVPAMAPDEARAALLRRYLHCYGPSRRADFATWLGIRPGQVGPWWDLLAGELSEVAVASRRGWMLSVDAANLPADRPHGVRLLPPGDPYTQLRDREMILDRARHRTVWRPVGPPGAIVADGLVAGTWRSRMSGRTLVLTLSVFDATRGPDPAALEEEVRRLAHLRAATAVTVRHGPPGE